MTTIADSLDLANIQQTVQHNCAISDARYSREYSLCIYLLRLREFYRWQNKIPFGEAIDQKALGSWVSDTETHWDDIEETEFKTLTIAGQHFDPFNAADINKQLNDSGFHYSAGLGRMGQPHFVLAKQLAAINTDQYTCIECGEELARDTITLPAMAQDKTIYIRHESFTELIWQMLDEWSINKPAGPMARLVHHYNLTNKQDLDQSLKAASHHLSEVIKQHELGEIAAAELLGEGYQKMTQAFHGKPGEMQIRAIRDLLADSLRTLPMIETTGITENGATPYLDFWLASLNGYREKIFNQTNPNASLFSEDATTRYNALVSMINTEQTRWHTVATNLLEQYLSRSVELNVDESIANSLDSAP